MTMEHGITLDLATSYYKSITENVDAWVEGQITYEEFSNRQGYLHRGIEGQDDLTPGVAAFVHGMMLDALKKTW